MNIFEYVPLRDIEILPMVCRGSRDILSRQAKSHWDSLKRVICTPDNRGVTWGGSPGSTALIVKAAYAETTCVVCKTAPSSAVHRHTFYDVMVCNRCKCSNPVFRTMGLKTACRKFFLSPEDHVDDHRIEKIPRGSNFTVLENHVRLVASAVYPRGALKRKLEYRDLKTELTEKRKRQNREERVRLISDKFIHMTGMHRIRVSPDLRSFCRVNDMVSKYGVWSHVYGDSCCFKVTSTMTPSMVAERLVDFASILTFMEKKGLLDYTSDPSDNTCNPSHILKRYLKNGMHYYESIGMYAEAKDLFTKREKRMFAHIGSRELDPSKREQLARTACAEDGVEFDEYMFDDFVRFQVGNPVTIARKKRKIVYMNAHGYMTYYSNAMYLHGDDNEARVYAEYMATARTMGLPPMFPTCIVDYY